MLDRNKWNHLTESQKKSWAQARLKMLKICLEILYLMYMYKEN